MSTIKAGYRITVVSWENDADNYNTLSVDGLQDEKEVQILVKLISLLKKAHHDGGHGNLYEPDEHQLENLADAIIALGEDVVSYVCEGFLDKEKGELGYQFSEIIGDYTGYSECYHTRMVESIVVEYIPEDVTFEDVTAQFV